VRQVVVRHMWALPRFFFEVCCPNGSSGHSQRSHPGKEGHTGHAVATVPLSKLRCTGISGKTVPLLTLWYDVMEGPPHPKLNGHQRVTPGGACGAKGLGTFAQTPVSGGFPRLTLQNANGCYCCPNPR